MNLADCMDAVGDRLDTITGLRVYRYPPDDLAAPAAVVTYPDEYLYDETLGRGMDRITLPVVVFVGKVSDRASRDRIAAYADGAGARSVKGTLEADVESYTAFDSVRVTGAEFDTIQVAGVDYLAVTFSLDIAGEGAA